MFQLIHALFSSDPLTQAFKALLTHRAAALAQHRRNKELNSRRLEIEGMITDGLADLKGHASAYTNAKADIQSAFVLTLD